LRYGGNRAHAGANPPGFAPAWARFPPYLKCKIHHLVPGRRGFPQGSRSKNLAGRFLDKSTKSAISLCDNRRMYPHVPTWSNMVQVVPPKRLRTCTQLLDAVAPFNVLAIRHPAVAGQVRTCPILICI